MENAYSYKRVSSQEQKEKKNSIPEQENRINKFAKEKNIQMAETSGTKPGVSGSVYHPVRLVYHPANSGGGGLEFYIFQYG